jgi:hypothetical protein
MDTSVQNDWQLHGKVGGNLSYLNIRSNILCIMLKSGAKVRLRDSSLAESSASQQAMRKFALTGLATLLLFQITAEGGESR